MRKAQTPYAFTPGRRAVALANLSKARAAPPTARQQAARRRNVRKAQARNRGRYWRLTPRRRAAILSNLVKARAASKPPYRLTPRRLKACRANLRKARAAMPSYRLTPRRLAANRANLAIARAKKTPENFQRSRFNAVKHGLDIRSLEETLKAIDDNPQESAKLSRLLKRTFAPQDDIERKLVRRLTAATRLRLRLYRAQAHWEAETLERVLGSGPAFRALDADQTRARACALMEILLKHDRMSDRAYKLTGRVERVLRALLWKRTGEDPHFRIITKGSREELKELDRLEADSRVWERLEQGGPEVQKIVEKIFPKWELR